MIPSACATGRLHDRRYRYPLRLLIGTACATWIDIAQAQTDVRPIDTLPPSVLSCTARFLFTPITPVSVHAAKADTALEIPRLRVNGGLSFAAARANESSDHRAAAAQVVAAAAKIEEPEQPVPFEAIRPGPSHSVSNAAVPKTDNLPDLSAVRWAIPPVRWGGNASSNYYLNDSSGVGRTFSETQILNLRASSYIYQPWYAQVSGDIGLLSGSSRQSGGDSSETTAGRSTSVTYGGNLNLFPQSRFPFQAYVQSSDSRADANTEGSRYTSLRMGARQSYRPEVGPESYSGSVDRSIINTANVRSVVDALQGTYATTIADHALGANARFSRTVGDVGGQGSNLLNLTGTHSWRSGEEMTVASSVNYSNNQIRVLTGTGVSQNNSDVLQAVSSLTWLPRDDLPLTIVGGGSFLRLNTETETGKVDLTNLTGYANAIYRFSKNLSATAGLTLSQAESSGVSQFSSAQNASVTYSGNPRVLGNYFYNWGVSSALSNQSVTGGGANRSVSAQIQHSLLRNVVMNEASAITVNASQSVSRVDNSTTGQSDILTHAGGASWRVGIGERTLGMLSATFSDSISRGDFPGHLRSLSAQGNMQMRLSDRSSLAASLNLVLSQQLGTQELTQTVTSSPGVPAVIINNVGKTLNGSGQVSYAHRNPFGIANLIYTATFQANASQTNLRLISGDPNALAWQASRELRQNVDYRIGRLTFRATSSFARLNGRDNASLFFTIGREIGDF